LKAGIEASAEREAERAAAIDDIKHRNDPANMTEGQLREALNVHTFTRDWADERIAAITARLAEIAA
jgi:hypothetical protein